MPACCMEAVVSEVAAVDWSWLQAPGGLPGFDGEGKTGMFQSKLSAKSVVAVRSFVTTKGLAVSPGPQGCSDEDTAEQKPQSLGHAGLACLTLCR